jgi:hypothetical protein
MISIGALWLPIVVAAVFIFFVSFVLHMLLPWHKGDYKKLPSEDEIREALRRYSIPPGDYMTPYGGGPEAMKDPAFIQKMKDGPVLLITARKPGNMALGTPLLQWFGYCLLVGVFAAAVAGSALGPGAGYRPVFHFAALTAFAGYSLALLHDSIWFSRPWGTTVRNVIDGLVYGLVTGGTFGWLWPK